jgi:hypothetical protein
MFKTLAPLIGVLVAVPLQLSLAQPRPQPPGPNQTHACQLLTGAEVSSALGARSAPSQENNFAIPDGPSRGQRIAMCAWRLGPEDMVRVSVAPALQGTQRAQGLAAINQSFEQMKADGWKEDAKDFGDVHCSTMMPPANERDAPQMTGCMGEVRGKAISLSSMSATKQAPIDSVKELFDKAAARLP